MPAPGGSLGSFEEQVDVLIVALQSSPQELFAPSDDGLIRLKLDTVAAENPRHFRRSLDAVKLDLHRRLIFTLRIELLDMLDLALKIAGRNEAGLCLASGHFFNGIQEPVFDAMHETHQ